MTRYAVLVVAAVVLQTAASRLPGSPHVVLAVVAAVGLDRGPRAGMLVGLATGLLLDLSGDHELGRLALAHLLAGALAGLLQDDVGGRLLVPLVAGAGTATAAVLVFAGEGVLLGDPRVTGSAFWRSLAVSVPYCAALTPVVAPLVAALLRPGRSFPRSGWTP